MSHEYRVRARHERFRGRVFTVLTDEVDMPGGDPAERDYVLHLGAVAVAAVDDADRVVLIRQYRHALGQELWELPAGLIDVAGEELPAAAARELSEEVDLTAAHWQLLLDLHSSPGYSNEVVRIYLARGLAEVPEMRRPAWVSRSRYALLTSYRCRCRSDTSVASYALATSESGVSTAG